jgi:inositol-pentakisphosphate 2-kinase
LVENSKDLLPDFIQALMPLLYETTLLPKMATLQRTLDALDIEGLVKLWNAHHPGDSSPIGTNAPDPDLKEWIQFTEEYLKSNGGQDYEITDLGAMDEARLRFYILCYLMSATFKDCSVILRLDSGMPDSITAIDLDPKAIDRLKKWEAQDREIVLGFKEGLASGEITQAPCTDAKVEASLTM